MPLNSWKAPSRVVMQSHSHSISVLTIHWVEEDGPGPLRGRVSTLRLSQLARLSSCLTWWSSCWSEATLAVSSNCTACCELKVRMCRGCAEVAPQCGRAMRGLSSGDAALWPRERSWFGMRLVASALEVGEYLASAKHVSDEELPGLPGPFWACACTKQPMG